MTTTKTRPDTGTKTPSNKVIEESMTAYFKLREEIADLTRAYEAAKADKQALMDQLEGHMLGRLQKIGVRQLATSAGTVYIERSRKPRVGDWGAFLVHIMKTGRVDYLQKRVAERTILTDLDDGMEEMPGLTVIQEDVVKFRSA